MSAQLFDQLSGPLSKILPGLDWIKRSVKYGIKCDVGIERNGDYNVSTMRRGALFTNVLSPFGKFECVMTDDYYYADGINAKVLNDYGRIDTGMLLDELKVSLGYRVNVAHELAMQAGDNSTENCVGVLINLLRWYFIKLGDKKDFMVAKEDEFYNDGHVRVSYGAYLDEDFANEFEPRFYNDVNVEYFGENSVIEDDFFMPNLQGMNSKEIGILIKYIGTIENEYPLRLAFGSPRLTSSIHIKPSTRYDDVGYDFNETASDLLNTMSKFVFANRLQSQFDLAYSAVIMAMYAPLPRAAEANGWISPVNEFNMPRAGTVRGLTNKLVREQSFCARPEALLTWSNFKYNPKRSFVHAVAVCETLYTGVFELITTAGSGDITGMLEAIGINSFEAMTPIKLFTESAAFRLGKQFTMCWDSNVGPVLTRSILCDEPVQRDIVVEKVGDVSGYNLYRQTGDPESKLRLRSAVVAPALFPVLSMGINDDRYYLNKLNYSANMSYDPVTESLFTNSSSVANRMMNIMRITGNDVTVQDMITQIKHKNWAANSNGQVMPMFKPNEQFGAYRIKMTDIVARKKNWLKIDNVVGNLEISVAIRPKTYVIMLNGKFAEQAMSQYKPVKSIPKPLAAIEFTDVVLQTSSQNLPYNYKDFLLLAPQLVNVVATSSLEPLANEQLRRQEPLIEEDGQQEELTDQNYSPEDDL